MGSFRNSVSKKKTFIILLSIFLVTLALYFPVLSTYFAQDDFFHFKVAMTDGSLLGFIKLFGFYPFDVRKIAFYRPLFREVPYNIFYQLFGLNPVPFRILSFVVHYANIILVYQLVSRLFNNKKISYLASFLYAIAAAHVASLYFMSAGLQTMGATMFMLLALLSFWNNRKLFSFVFFLLALASHELSSVLPILLVGLIYLKKKNFKNILPYFPVLAVYFYLNYFVIGFSEAEIQYGLVFNLKKTLNTYFWYGLWALGMPEMLVDFVGSGLSLDPRLMRFWGQYFRIIFPSFVISLVFLAVSFWRALIKRRLSKMFWFLCFWIPVGLLPVIFLPAHKLSYYLAPVLPAFWGAVSFIIVKSKNKYLLTAFVLSIAILSYSSVKLGEKTYWMVNRGRIAEKLIDQVKSKYPQLPQGATVYFTNDPDYPDISGDWGGTSRQAFYALSGPDALQLLYKDPELEVFYEDINEKDFDIDSESVYEIVAKID